MTNSYTINVNGIGPVLFEKSRRAKRLIVSISTSKGARVAVPMRTSFKKALDFVNLQKEWIQRQLVKIGEDENRNKTLRDAFLAIDKADAKKRLKDRLSYMARKHGFIYNKVHIRNQKTRWGSCSHKNNISLNIKILNLPEELGDYVMLHELTHTQIKNHSAVFWAELDRYVADSKAVSSRLRKYGLGLF